MPMGKKLCTTPRGASATCSNKATSAIFMVDERVGEVTHAGKEGVETGGEEDSEECSEHHAAEGCDAYFLAAGCAGSGGDNHGQNTEDEGNSRHEHGPETEAGAIHCSLLDGSVILLMILFAEFHHEDGVFG